jgi:ribosomal protein L35AE/L33A
MYVLRIEHAVLNFDAWKKAFDSDPVGRQKSGVRAYRVMRSCDNPNQVMIDLEFETVSQAQALVANLRTVWGDIQGKVIANPRALITEVVEMRNF